MIHHLSLPLKKEATTKVVPLAASAARSWALCIGDPGFMQRMQPERPDRLLVVSSIHSAAKILRDQLPMDVKPTYIICNLSANGKPADLVSQLRSMDALADVPVFGYVPQLTAELRQQIRASGGIDNVLTAETTISQFVAIRDQAIRLRTLATRQMQRNSGVAPRKAPSAYVNHFVKRGIDIMAAGSGLLLLSPLLLLIAALIKLESKGPVLYISRRAGQGYRIFPFYKFRTMVNDADKQVNNMAHLNQYDTGDKGPVFFKISNDPRVTRLGAFLRNSSLDEIPQLLNVLLGHMSLVGNRPLPLYEAASLTTDSYCGRFMAPAGLTGLWQVKKRGKKDMSVEERIRLDIEYAQKHTVLYDMWILASTPNALIQKDNV